MYSRSDGVELLLAGGGMLRAKRAIVTVPLGVLKAGDVVFEPPLPETKADAIKSLGFGVLDKVYPVPGEFMKTRPCLKAV